MDIVSVLLVLAGVLLGVGLAFGSLVLRRVYTDWRMKQRWVNAGKHWKQFLIQMEAVQWDPRWAKNYQNKEIPLEDYYEFLEERRRYDESTGVVPQKETTVSKLSRKLEGYPTFGRKVSSEADVPEIYVGKGDRYETDEGPIVAMESLKKVMTKMRDLSQDK